MIYEILRPGTCSRGRVQVPESVVSLTQYFTDVLPVDKCSVEGDLKVVDLVFSS